MQVIGGPNTKMPKDFSSFVHESANKCNLLEFIYRQWQLPQYASRLRGRQIFFVNEGDCACLTSNDGQQVAVIQMAELASSQEEADTRIVLHCI